MLDASSNHSSPRHHLGPGNSQKVSGLEQGRLTIVGAKCEGSEYPDSPGAGLEGQAICLADSCSSTKYLMPFKRNDSFPVL